MDQCKKGTYIIVPSFNGARGDTALVDGRMLGKVKAAVAALLGKAAA